MGFSWGETPFFLKISRGPLVFWGGFWPLKKNKRFFFCPKNPGSRPVKLLWVFLRGKPHRFFFVFFSVQKLKEVLSEIWKKAKKKKGHLKSLPGGPKEKGETAPRKKSLPVKKKKCQLPNRRRDFGAPFNFERPARKFWAKKFFFFPAFKAPFYQKERVGGVSRKKG